MSSPMSSSMAQTVHTFQQPVQTSGNSGPKPVPSGTSFGASAFLVPSHTGQPAVVSRKTQKKQPAPQVQGPAALSASGPTAYSGPTAARSLGPAGMPSSLSQGTAPGRHKLRPQKSGPQQQRQQRQQQVPTGQQQVHPQQAHPQQEPAFAGSMAAQHRAAQSAAFNQQPPSAPAAVPASTMSPLINCGACAMKYSRDDMYSCAPENHYVCHHCVNFFLMAVRHPPYRTHAAAPACTLHRGLLSVRQCYGCLYQRCLDVGIKHTKPVVEAFPDAARKRPKLGAGAAAATTAVTAANKPAIAAADAAGSASSVAPAPSGAFRAAAVTTAPDDDHRRRRRKSRSKSKSKSKSKDKGKGKGKDKNRTNEKGKGESRRSKKSRKASSASGRASSTAAHEGKADKRALGHTERQRGQVDDDDGGGDGGPTDASSTSDSASSSSSDTGSDSGSYSGSSGSSSSSSSSSATGDEDEDVSTSTTTTSSTANAAKKKLKEKVPQAKQGVKPTTLQAQGKTQQQQAWKLKRRDQSTMDSSEDEGDDGVEPQSVQQAATVPHEQGATKVAAHTPAHQPQQQKQQQPQHHQQGYAAQLGAPAYGMQMPMAGRMGMQSSGMGMMSPQGAPSQLAAGVRPHAMPHNAMAAAAQQQQAMSYFALQQQQQQPQQRPQQQQQPQQQHQRGPQQGQQQGATPFGQQAIPPNLAAMYQQQQQQPPQPSSSSHHSSAVPTQPVVKREQQVQQQHSSEEVGVAEMLAGMKSNATVPQKQRRNKGMRGVPTGPMRHKPGMPPLSSMEQFHVSWRTHGGSNAGTRVGADAAASSSAAAMSAAQSKSTFKTSRPRGQKRQSTKGFCLGCWKTKELEERYAVGMKSKFMLCNACRKTHLTKSVIPVFERKARQPAQATDMQTRLRIRAEMEAEWMARTKDPTVCRLLDLWLNVDWRRVVCNGVMSYIPSDEIQSVAESAVYSVLHKHNVTATMAPLKPAPTATHAVTAATDASTDASAQQQTPLQPAAEDSEPRGGQQGAAHVADVAEAGSTGKKEGKDGEEDDEKEGTSSHEDIMFTVRFLRVAGHLHAVKLPQVPQKHLPAVRKAITKRTMAMAADAIRNALGNNEDLAKALQRHQLSPQDVVVRNDDVELLLSL